MILRDRPSMWKLFFVMQGSIVPKILPQVAVIGGLSALVVLIHLRWPHFLPIYDGGPFALLGIAISVFLSFRNSACYDRWWEGRKQWGALIRLSRDMARQTLILPEADRRRMLDLVCAFAHALVQRLRPEQTERDKVVCRLSAIEADQWQESAFPTDYILRRMGALLAEWRAAGRIGDIVFQILDRTISGMAGVQAACERIHNTPAPFAYSLLLHRTAWLFCLLLPFGLVGALGLFMPVVVIIVAYTFFGLDALGDELQEPFGLSDNSLPLRAIVRTIEIDLLDGLGVHPLPPSLTSSDYVLR